MADIRAKRAKLKDLIPDPHNANDGTVRGLAMLEHSIEQFGIGRGILLDNKNGILAGNKTVQEAIDLGFEDVIIVPTDGKQLVATQRVDLAPGDPRTRAIAVADNRVAEVDLSWSGEALRGLIDDGLDLSRFFDADELDAILAGVVDEAKADPGARTDEAEKLQAVWKVRRCDLWLVDRHRLLCGDSTKSDDVARLMGGDHFRLMWTDPPYGVSYADKNEYLNAVARGNSIQTPIENDHMTESQTEALLREAFSLAAQYGTAGAGCYVAAPAGPLHRRFIDALDASGFRYKHQLVWVKNQFVLGRSDYHYRHEPILYGWKDDGAHYFADDHTLDSVFEVDKPHNSDLHPTQKPIDLVRPMIEHSSKRDELVYDPFAGSGTTGIACEQTGRQARLIELSPAYCAVVLQRFKDCGLSPHRESEGT
jgi:DNA modification methylase